MQNETGIMTGYWKSVALGGGRPYMLAPPPTAIHFQLKDAQCITPEVFPVDTTANILIYHLWSSLSTSLSF